MCNCKGTIKETMKKIKQHMNNKTVYVSFINTQYKNMNCVINDYMLNIGGKMYKHKTKI